MAKKFESINMHNNNPKHSKKFSTMEDAINYFQGLGKVVVVESSFAAIVGGLTRGASTQVYPRTIIHLFAPDHNFDDTLYGDVPEDVIIIQENTPIAYPLVRLGSKGR